MPPGPNGAEVRTGWCPMTDIPRLQAFIDSYWRPGHVLSQDADLLRWQYRHRERGDSLSVLVAEDEQGLLGILGLVQVDFSLYGTRLPADWLALWCVAQRGQGQRVGLALLREVLHGQHRMVGCLGFNQTVRRILATLGFEVWDAIPRWVRVISPPAMEGLLAQQAEPHLAGGWISRHATSQRGAASVDNPAVRLVEWTEGAAGRWDRAWQERFAPRLVGTWRDAGYLRWRYLEHPRFHYEVRFAEDTAQGALIGLLVYRLETVRDRPEKVLRVVELLGDGTEAGALLSRAVVEAGEEAGVAFADFYCTSEELAAPLEAAGFAREETLSCQIPTLFQPLDFTRTNLPGAMRLMARTAPESPALFRTASVYCTRSDGDQDRPN